MKTKRRGGQQRKNIFDFLPRYNTWGQFLSNVGFSVKHIKMKNLSKLDRTTQKQGAKKITIYQGDFIIQSSGDKYIMNLLIGKHKTDYYFRFTLSNRLRIKCKKNKEILISILKQLQTSGIKEIDIMVDHESIFKANKIKSAFTMPMFKGSFVGNENVEILGLRTGIREKKKLKLSTIIDFSDDLKTLRMFIRYRTRVKIDKHFMQSWHNLVEKSINMYIIKRG